MLSALACVVGSLALAADIELHVGLKDAAATGLSVPRLADVPAHLRSLRAEGRTEAAVIVLHEAHHALDAPLVLTPDEVGEGLSFVTGDGVEATISGGVMISGWTPGDDGQWYAKIPAAVEGAWWFEELFVDGKRATRAREPDAEDARVVTAGADNRTSFTFDPVQVDASGVDESCEVVLLHDWSISRVRIASIDRETHTITVAHPIGCKAPHFAITNFEPHPRFFIEGGARLVDEPGEWALVRRTGELIYRPRPGQSPETTKFIAPRAAALVVASGTPDRLLAPVSFTGIRFAHVSWPIPDYGYAEGQAAFYEQRGDSASDGTRDAVPAAITFTWARAPRLDRCTIESVGGTGVVIGAGCRDGLIVDSIIRDCGANGVMLGENTAREAKGGPWWQTAPQQVATNNAIEYCLVEKCGQRFFGAVGVWVGLAEKTRVEHCEVRDLPYTGVSVGWRWDETPTPCRETLIAGNHIHHVMQVLSDGGGIYTLGLQPGAIIRGNAIHDVRANVGRAPSNGIFLDQGTTGMVVERNIFWNIDRTPIRWHWTYQNTVRDNLFVLAGGQEIARYDRARPEDIAYENNEIVPDVSMVEKSVEAITARAGPRP
ncbi:MAG: right-handed parallel beta-helix repeat-containing protein [Phycisphaerales bacterium]|nr:right-handed parallel beta-helix repeat-containing protein [Phycisphaerales bacterium]